MWINKNGETKRILKDDLIFYINEGWKRGSNVNTNFGRVCILNRNTNEQKYIQPEELQEYLDNGWVTGRYGKTIDKKVIINKNNKDII